MRAKTRQAWFAALASILLGTGVAQAQGLAERARNAGIANSTYESVGQNESSASVEFSGRFDESTNERVPRTADEFFQMLNNDVSAPAAEPSTPGQTKKKRYLVCFLQTKRFAYEDINITLVDEEGRPKVVTIAKKGEVYDEPMRLLIESSYCAAGITLRSLGNFDEMLTVADQYLNKKQVKAVFDALAEETNPDDEIFIYWNGHGASLGTDDDGDEQTVVGGQGFDVDEMVSLYETNMEAPTEQAVRETCLSDDEVGKMFAKLKGRKVVAFFETCHSGGLGQNSETRPISRLPLALTAPKPELVTTWDDLKSKVDMTDELLKFSGLMFAMRSVGTEYSVINAAPTDADDNAENEANEAETSRTQARTSFGASLRALYEASESKDITLQTLEKLAVAFTSGQDQNSWARTRFIDENGELRVAFANPGACAILLAFQKANEAKRPLTFEQFSYILSDVVKRNSELANQVERIEGREASPQEARFLSNWDDAVLYEPNWKMYWDQKWNVGDEKWMQRFEQLQRMENAQ